MIIILVITVLLICLFEAAPLTKKKLWKELFTVLCIVSIAIFLEISKISGVITPIKLMENLFEPIGRLYLNQL